MPESPPALLDVRDLRVAFRTTQGTVHAVNGIDFSVGEGLTLCLVGESGSGKSAACLGLVGLAGPKADVTGTASWRGRQLIGMSSRELRMIRGREIAMVFQDPLSSLNPVQTIGKQMIEAVRLHTDCSARDASSRTIEMLQAVEIPHAAQRMREYPHQFSGGMRQRVMIAMALINRPDLLIADEPTTALDVTTQAQILLLLRRLQTEFGTAVILITHDLGVVAEVADEVVVMYAGSIVEKGPVADVFASAEHPYTWGLLGSLPRLDRTVDRLSQIPGQPPSLLRLPRGCAFEPRCAFAFEECSREHPSLRSESDPRHRFACYLSSKKRSSSRSSMIDSVSDAVPLDIGA